MIEKKACDAYVRSGNAIYWCVMKKYGDRSVSRIRRTLMLVLIGLLIVPLMAQNASETQPADGAEPVGSVETTDTPLVFIFTIDDSPISGMTLRFTERALNEAKVLGADVIVCELDTPGGEVGATLEICQAIKRLDVRKAAWINNDAYSAGTMIALKFPEIVVSSNARMGDCAPILISPQGGLMPIGDTERSKITSPVLAEFRDSAKTNGYAQAWCEAMVSLKPPIYEIENKQSGEKRYVFEDQLGKYELSTDADAELEPSDWTLGEEVWPAEQLVTLLTDEVMRFGFGKAVVDSDTELLEYLGLPDAQIVRFQTNWSEELVTFLTHPVVRSILTILMLMGLYSEMQSPGLGLPGGVALAAMLVLLGAPYLTGLANSVEILIILVGLGLIVLEVFVIPGFGLAGIAGIVLMFVGLLMTFVPEEPGPGFIPQLPGTWQSLETGFFTIIISFAISLVGIGVLTRMLGSIPLFNRLILKTEQQAVPVSESVSAGVGGTGLEDVNLSVGQRGVAAGDLKPGGRAEIDQRFYEVTTRGGWIEDGTAVRVVEVSGSRVIVEEA